MHHESIDGHKTHDHLNKIMQDPRLHPEKYGGWSFKTVKIYRANILVYQASYSLLSLLFDRYGDLTFGDAIDKWHASKRGQNV